LKKTRAFEEGDELLRKARAFEEGEEGEDSEEDDSVS
jgi:hypothetical protein